MRGATIAAVKENKADFGVAWDGDFDRCFLFDENGGFIEGYYIVGLLAAAMLKLNPGAKVIHDPRLVWNTIEMVREAGGVPVMSKTGHAFIKERMRAENAIYGGEMSAHRVGRCRTTLRQQRIGDAVRERSVRLMLDTDEFKRQMGRQTIDHHPGAAIARIGDDFQWFE